jgi:hypothetical protein
VTTRARSSICKRQANTLSTSSHKATQFCLVYLDELNCVALTKKTGKACVYSCVSVGPLAQASVAICLCNSRHTIAHHTHARHQFTALPKVLRCLRRTFWSTMPTRRRSNSCCWARTLDRGAPSSYHSCATTTLTIGRRLLVRLPAGLRTCAWRPIPGDGSPRPWGEGPKKDTAAATTCTSMPTGTAHHHAHVSPSGVWRPCRQNTVTGARDALCLLRRRRSCARASSVSSCMKQVGRCAMVAAATSCIAQVRGYGCMGRDAAEWSRQPWLCSVVWRDAPAMVLRWPPWYRGSRVEHHT